MKSVGNYFFGILAMGSMAATASASCVNGEALARTEATRFARQTDRGCNGLSVTALNMPQGSERQGYSVQVRCVRMDPRRIPTRHVQVMLRPSLPAPLPAPQDTCEFASAQELAYFKTCTYPFLEGELQLFTPVGARSQVGQVSFSGIAGYPATAVTSDAGTVFSYQENGVNHRIVYAANGQHELRRQRPDGQFQRFKNLTCY